jgi:hypothetical protein
VALLRFGSDMLITDERVDVRLIGRVSSNCYVICNVSLTVGPLMYHMEHELGNAFLSIFFKLLLCFVVLRMEVLVF